MGLLAFSRRSLGLHSPPAQPSPVCCSPDGRIVAYLTEGSQGWILEGLASGCLMLSVPTGFAAEFQSGNDGIWHLPITANAQQWSEQIQYCLKTTSENELMVGGSLSPARKAFLKEASFDYLAQQLSQIVGQSALNSRKESLDG